jgi:general secretion pathway protein M
MNLQLSPWMSRAAALALLGLLLMAAYAVVLHPLFGRYEGYQSTLQDLQSHLARYRAVAAERGAVEKRIEAFRRERGNVEVYLRNATSTLASAELQERIKQVVEGGGGTLVSTQTLPDRSDGGLVQVAIKVRMKGEVESMQKVFYELESGRPLLFIDNVFVRSRMIRRGRNLDTAADLDINFDVVGYMRAEPAK